MAMVMVASNISKMGGDLTFYGNIILLKVKSVLLRQTFLNRESTLMNANFYAR
jgi:hypothetical protein